MVNNLTEAIKAVREINDCVKDLDASVRERACDVLLRVAFGQSINELSDGSPAVDESGSTSSATKDDDLFAKASSVDMTHNVKLLTAVILKEGRKDITSQEIVRLGESSGLVLPKRVDQTLNQAKARGNSMYEKKGRGKYRITSTGQIELGAMFLKS